MCIRDRLKPLFNFIVNVAVPPIFPAISVQVPFDFPATLTTFELDVFQDVTESPFVNVTFKEVTFCCGFIIILDVETFIVAFNLFPTLRISLNPQVVHSYSCLAARNTVA